MLYRQKKDTYIRNYDGVGYITSTGLFNDRCTNESGTAFLCALSRKAQTLDELVDKIMPAFAADDVSRETIRKDFTPTIQRAIPPCRSSWRGTSRGSPL